MKKRKKFLAYIAADVMATGLGMGVPFLNILLGFFVGWYIVKQSKPYSKKFDFKKLLPRIFKYSLLTSAVTFIFMFIIWGILALKLFDPATDYENIGHPFIVYDPKLSFVAWLVLMIFISPFLQLLTTVFGAFVTLIIDIKRD